MSDERFSDDEQALVDAYARVAPPSAVIRQRMSAGSPARPPRRPARLALAAMAFAATGAAAAGVLAVRGLHGVDMSHGAVSVAPHTPAPPSPPPLPACRLPVQDATTHQARFLGLPAGRYTADPPVTAGGNRYDGWPISWDAPLQRWVPAQWSMVSPDGRMWLYYAGGRPDTLGVLHLATASGQDRVVRFSGGILGWLPQGVLTTGLAGPPASHPDNTYRWLDPVSGATRDAGIPPGGWRWYGGSTLWQDRFVTHAGEAGFDRQVESYDLTTHARAAWFSLDAYLGPAVPETPSMTSEGPAHTAQDNRRAMALLGVDGSGHPVVHLGTRDPGTEVQTLYLDAPGHVVVIDKGEQPSRLDPYEAFGDAHGLWIVDYRSDVLLYTPAGGLQDAGSATPPVGGSITDILGPCR